MQRRFPSSYRGGEVVSGGHLSSEVAGSKPPAAMSPQTSNFLLRVQLLGLGFCGDRTRLRATSGSAAHPRGRARARDGGGGAADRPGPSSTSVSGAPTRQPPNWQMVLPTTRWRRRAQVCGHVRVCMRMMVAAAAARPTCLFPPRPRHQQLPLGSGAGAGCIFLAF